MSRYKRRRRSNIQRKQKYMEKRKKGYKRS
jgi:hypothetical protein